ncbi:MAG: hypothetical protein UH211_03975 [Agathobacter sp.]|nr:hypothetical protein [Agathobacter sp.]
MSKLATESSSNHLSGRQKNDYNNIEETMKEVQKMVQAYLEYIILGSMFSGILLLMIMTIILGIVSRRIRRIEIRMMKILTEVNSYIDHVVESEEMLQKEEKKQKIKRQKEKENRLINSVLEEIFP